MDCCIGDYVVVVIKDKGRIQRGIVEENDENGKDQEVKSLLVTVICQPIADPATARCRRISVRGRFVVRG